MVKKLEKVAAKRPCEVILHPTEPYYTEPDIRLFQGCPTVAVTKGGRIFAGWFSGGFSEPHPDNFNILTYSDDGGKTFRDPVLVIPSSRIWWVHAFDIQFWVAPDGRLFVYWCQQDMEPIGYAREGATIGGWMYDLLVHSEWCMVCDNPDADELVFSEPRRLDKGFMRNKPIVLADGRWMNCNYDLECDRYGYSISEDQGKTWTRYYAGQKFETPFDESMAYQKKDGTIRLMARTAVGEIAECSSADGGKTWTESKLSGIPNPNSRFCVRRTPSGRLMMVFNDHSKERTNMTVCLSEDEGETWKYSRCIDSRAEVSYPDADFHDGKIYVIYDRERYGEREILLAIFTEEDIMNGETPIDLKIVCKSHAEPVPAIDRDGKPYLLDQVENGRPIR